MAWSMAWLIGMSSCNGGMVHGIAYRLVAARKHVFLPTSVWHQARLSAYTRWRTRQTQELTTRRCVNVSSTTCSVVTLAACRISCIVCRIPLWVVLCGSTRCFFHIAGISAIAPLPSPPVRAVGLQSSRTRGHGVDL